jgi:GNAT superfamily N-acetyltransferase
MTSPAFGGGEEGVPRGPEAAGARIPLRMGSEPPVWRFGDLLIRRYRPSDFDTVLALHRAGLAQVGLRPGDGVYYEYDLFQLRELYLRDGGEFLVGALDVGRPVAMGGLRRFRDPGAELSRDVGEMVRLRVRQDVQRRGYGSAVAWALEQRARELGYRSLRADTTAYQRPALELYRGSGWRETRREVINGITNVHLEKPLPPPSPP